MGFNLSTLIESPIVYPLLKLGFVCLFSLKEDRRKITFECILHVHILMFPKTYSFYTCLQTFFVFGVKVNYKYFELNEISRVLFCGGMLQLLQLKEIFLRKMICKRLLSLRVGYGIMCNYF